MYKAKLRSKSRFNNKVMALSQRFEAVGTSSYRLSSSVNSQNIADMTTGQVLATNQCNMQFGIYTGDILVTGPSKAPGVLSSLGSLAIGNDIGITTSSMSGTTKVFQKYCFMETEIANLAQYPVEVDIYEVIAKHDLGSAFSATDYFSGSQVLSPTIHWSYGLANYITNTPAGSSGKSTSTTLGTFPSDSELFNTFWKVCSRHKVSLAVGGVHIHESQYNMDKFVETQRSQYNALLGGITRNIMVVLTGTPVRDSITSSAVAIGPATVNVCHTFTYKAQSIPNNKMSSTNFNYAGTVVTAEATVQSSPQVSNTLNPD
nr:MAG: capsid protein [Cressdnaviricota sp.]